MRVAVLALQGDFAEHIQIFRQLNVEAFEARTEADLEAADALVIPGGESTTILKLLSQFELKDSMKKRIEDGLPVFGTCAGAIVLAKETTDGEEPLGVLPVKVNRNAYGRQIDSFETTLDIAGIGEDVKVAFIRAPIMCDLGPGVEVLGRYESDPVIVRSGNILASTFHAEIVGETRVHRWFMQEVC